MEREHNQIAWAVWHIVILQRVKKVPSLQKLQKRKTKSVKPTPDQMWAAMLPMVHDK